MANRVLVILAGQIGAGKTTAASYLASTYGIAHRSFVDTFWLPVLRDRNLPPTRANLQELGLELMAKRGPMGLVDDMLAQLDRQSSYIVDDIRSPSVFEYWVSKEPDSKLIFLQSSFGARLPRLKLRDGIKSEEEQRAAERVSTETEINDLEPFAFQTLANDGDLIAFHRQLDQVAERIGLMR